MVERRVPQRKWSPSQKGITAKQLKEEMYPALVKELGPKEAEQYMKALHVDENTNVDLTKYRGGKQVQLNEALKDLRRVKNVRKERIPIARQILKSMMVPYEPASQRGLTQEKVADVEKETEEEFGAEIAGRFGKRFGAEGMPQEGDVASTREAKRSGWLGKWGSRNKQGETKSNGKKVNLK